jgi:hypothetical protein
MLTPGAKLEYRIERDGEKFVAVDSDEETVGIYETEVEAQADIAREKKEDALWERTKELMRHSVRTIMAEFAVDVQTALNYVNSAAGMTVLGMDEGTRRRSVEGTIESPLVTLSLDGRSEFGHGLCCLRFLGRQPAKREFEISTGGRRRKAHGAWLRDSGPGLVAIWKKEAF